MTPLDDTYPSTVHLENVYVDSSNEAYGILIDAMAECCIFDNIIVSSSPPAAKPFTRWEKLLSWLWGWLP